MDFELIEAARSGNLEEARRLLALGVDIDAKEDIFAGTALFFASFAGHTQVLALLLENGADVEARNNRGRTALTGASFRGHTEVVKLLLNKGADVNTADKFGKTPLIEACRGNHPVIAELLVQAGARLETRDGVGRYSPDSLFHRRPSRTRGATTEERRASKLQRPHRLDRSCLGRFSKATRTLPSSLLKTAQSRIPRISRAERRCY